MGVITTETETVSSTYNTLEITDLPINYRASGNGNSPYYLMEILPGMQTDQSGNLSIQGGLQSQSQFSVDGVSITNTTGNSPLHNAFPSAESIAEIKVQGIGSPAEFEQPGDVTTTTKGGTNTLHGSGVLVHSECRAQRSSLWSGHEATANRQRLRWKFRRAGRHPASLQWAEQVLLLCGLRRLPAAAHQHHREHRSHRRP